MIWDDNEDIMCVRCDNSRREIQHHLTACRDERRPYVFITPDMQQVSEIERILVPVSMLEEEVYKAEICTYLARKTGADILLLQAHDYGSHAKNNTQKIISHITSVATRTDTDLHYQQLEASSDSFRLTRECIERQQEFGHQLLLLTASREYGIDDIIFGPPERFAIRHSQVPVMLVNPRADLFSLCD